MPALSYMFHELEDLFDGRPTMLVLDEAWLFLRHETFKRQQQNWLKTLRKKNVACVYATQEIADAAKAISLQPSSNSAIQRSTCPTRRRRRRDRGRCIEASA